MQEYPIQIPLMLSVEVGLMTLRAAFKTLSESVLTNFVDSSLFSGEVWTSQCADPNGKAREEVS